MQKQTPKWLELFVEAFGSKGVVALAWWLGSLHAENIRHTFGSFPFLQIAGGAGSGKSTLIFVLYRLLGDTNAPMVDAARITRRALQRYLATSTDWPIVIEQAGQAQPAFDWESISACYSDAATSTFSVRNTATSQEYFRFRGALVITGTTSSNTVNPRSVQIALDRAQQSELSRVALEALLALPLAEMAAFEEAAKQLHSQLLIRLMKDTPVYMESLLDEDPKYLTVCDTKNHAQLRVLIDALAELFNLPPEQAQAAHAQVINMAWHCSVPY